MNTIINFILDQTQEAIKGLSDEHKAEVLSTLSNQMFTGALVLAKPSNDENIVIGSGAYYDPLINVIWDELEVIADVGALEMIVHTVETMLNDGKR